MGALKCRTRAVFFVVAVSSLVASAGRADDLAPSLLSKPRVLLKGAPGAAVRRAVEGARLRLLEPSCRALLSEFADAAGQPLQSRLDAMGLSAAEYVGAVLFVEGSNQKACSSGEALGGTQPGSRVVAFCGAAFAETERRNARFAEALVIHETFHSLGLGENPPSSGEITARVLGSCQERAPIANERRP